MSSFAIGLLVAAGDTRADPGPTPVWAAMLLSGILAGLGLVILCWPHKYERLWRRSDNWWFGKEHTTTWYGEEGSRRSKAYTYVCGGFLTFVGLAGLIGLATGVAHT